MDWNRSENEGQAGRLSYIGAAGGVYALPGIARILRAQFYARMVLI